MKRKQVGESGKPAKKKKQTSLIQDETIVSQQNNDPQHIILPPTGADISASAICLGEKSGNRFFLAKSGLMDNYSNNFQQLKVPIQVNFGARGSHLHIKQLVAVNGGSIVITDNGKCFVVATKEKETNVGTLQSAVRPKRIMHEHRVEKIAAAYDRVAFITATGRVFMCGRQTIREGIYGELDIDTTIPSEMFESEYPNIADVALASTTNLFITTTKQFCGCGLNSYGELGLGHKNPVKKMVQLDNRTNIVSMGGTSQARSIFPQSQTVFNAYLTNKNEVYVAGKIQQQEYPTWTKILDNVAEIKFGAGFMLSRLLNGNVVFTGDSTTNKKFRPKPFNQFLSKQFQRIFAGKDFIWGIDENNKLVGTGENIIALAGMNMGTKVKEIIDFKNMNMVNDPEWRFDISVSDQHAILAFYHLQTAKRDVYPRLFAIFNRVALTDIGIVTLH